jgi:hypothetical protein
MLPDHPALTGARLHAVLRRTRIFCLSGAATCLAIALIIATLRWRTGDVAEPAPRVFAKPSESAPPRAELPLPAMPAEMLRVPSGHHPAGGLPGESLGTDEADADDWADPAEGLSDDTQPPSP